jgi:hypothetical protein
MNTPGVYSAMSGNLVGELNKIRAIGKAAIFGGDI